MKMVAVLPQRQAARPTYYTICPREAQLRRYHSSGTCALCLGGRHSMGGWKRCPHYLQLRSADQAHVDTLMRRIGSERSLGTGYGASGTDHRQDRDAERTRRHRERLELMRQKETQKRRERTPERPRRGPERAEDQARTQKRTHPTQAMMEAMMARVMALDPGRPLAGRRRGQGWQ